MNPHVTVAPGKIVFDCFHLLRHVNEAVDTVRKEENLELVKKEIIYLNGSWYI